MWSYERERLRFDPVVLTPEQMRHAETCIAAVCDRGGWVYHAGAAGPDHVHVLLTAEAEGDAVRMWFKRWLGERMSARWARPEGASWWAESGSVKWVWTQDYFRNVLDYLNRQRATPK